MSVLIMVALATLLLIIFVESTRLDNAATFSYSQSIEAEQIGMGGVRCVVSQLQAEMAKDVSPDRGADGTSAAVFTNITAANINPQMTGTNSAMPDLLQISTNTFFFTGTASTGALQASSVSTTTPSVNGRLVSLSRWNQACLGLFPNDSAAPYWVMVSRAGPTNAAGISFGPHTAGSLNNPDPTNTNFVIGRYAYAIYDEGSLLDITTAGFSSSSLSAKTQVPLIKGTLAGADLSQIPGITDSSKLVGWRNAASAASASSYLNYVTNFASTNGFQQVAPGDTTFLSRQDLIQVAQSDSAGMTTNALPYLSTFTRELNAPSWGPSTNAGGSYNYANNATSITTTTTNCLVPLVRSPADATVPTYHDDGTAYSYTVKAGDPLVQHRFSLARINWLAGAATGTAPAASMAAAIQACFGLKWGPAQASDQYLNINKNGAFVWQYVGPTGSSEQASIETLAQVAAENPPREPNFFELLQAGILSGSLGVGSSQYEKERTYQVLKIGANIIDQYDTDSVPTIIEYLDPVGGYAWEAAGTESLPYLNVFKSLPGQDPSATSQLAIYFLFGLWNPYQLASTSAAKTQSPARPNVRIHFVGDITFANEWGYPTYTGQPDVPYGPNPPPAYDETLVLSTSSSHGVNGFATPALVTSADAASTLNNGTAAGGVWAELPSPPFPSGTTYVGFRFPNFQLNPISADTNPTDEASRYAAAQAAYATGASSSAYGNWKFFRTVLHLNTAGTPFNYWMEYQQPGTSAWIPYDFGIGLNDPATWTTPVTSDLNTAYISWPSPQQENTPPQGPALYDETTKYAASFQMGSVWGTVDPRASRLSFWQFIRNNGATWAPDTLISSIWDSGSTGYTTSGYGGPSGTTSGYDTILGTFFYPASLARNNAANSSPVSSYVDTDGVRRQGDSGYWPAATGIGSGNPYQNSADRPIILNRPFNSVGEMGYAFRDDPWRSLDFFSGTSADAGLLDLFCLNEVVGNVAAGRLNLNTQNTAVIEAVLNNTITDTIGLGSSLQAPGLAAALTNITSPTQPASQTSGPLVNRSDLVTKFVGSGAVTAADFSVASDGNIKSHREAVVRALADVGQTRTWNLMIDLVAEAGRFPPNAASLSQFVVKGERRYWLHVAIDRVTGQVIDQKLEIVAQ